METLNRFFFIVVLAAAFDAVPILAQWRVCVVTDAFSDKRQVSVHGLGRKVQGAGRSALGRIIINCELGTTVGYEWAKYLTGRGGTIQVDLRVDSNAAIQDRWHILGNNEAAGLTDERLVARVIQQFRAGSTAIARVTDSVDGEQLVHRFDLRGFTAAYEAACGG
mgnify:CR=1 FL=1